MGDYRELITQLLASGTDLDQIIADLRIENENTCAFCGNQSEYLCDHVLGCSGWVDSGTEKPYRCINAESVRHTCDAPICRQCRVKSGVTFFPPSMGGPDTTDFCPSHKNSIGGSGDIIELTTGEAEQQRLATWKMKYMQRFM